MAKVNDITEPRVFLLAKPPIYWTEFNDTIFYVVDHSQVNGEKELIVKGKWEGSDMVVAVRTDEPVVDNQHSRYWRIVDEEE